MVPLVAAYRVAAYILLSLVVLPLTVVAGDPLPGDKPKAVARPPVLAQAAQLHKASAKLVKDARSAKANASQFRIEVTFYREGLRELMRDNRKIAESNARLPEHALVDMVRMSALLHSAAECKTGRYIVCPAELMRNLESQQQLLWQQWQTIKANTAGSG